MNSYHENHPDFEIRQKYHDWKKAYGEYLARAGGFVSVKAMEKSVEESKKPSVIDMLKAIGGSVMYSVMQAAKGGKAATRGKRQNIRKTGANRGS